MTALTGISASDVKYDCGFQSIEKSASDDNEPVTSKKEDNHKTISELEMH